MCLQIENNFPEIVIGLIFFNYSEESYRTAVLNLHVSRENTKLFSNNNLIGSRVKVVRRTPVYMHESCQRLLLQKKQQRGASCSK